jgi:hypothetical protein
MGWCHEFGVEIDPRCSHPMAAGGSACSCPECGTVCRGRFEGGCEAVWERGLRLDAPARPTIHAPKPALALAAAATAVATNGTLPETGAGSELRVNGSQPAPVDHEAAPSHPGPPGPREDAGLVQRMALVEIALTALVGRVDRLVHMETALTALAEQAERLAAVRRELNAMAEQLRAQHQSRASLERHVADLGKVLGQLGLEVNDRLDLVETVLDDLESRASVPGKESADSAAPEVVPEAVADQAWDDATRDDATRDNATRDDDAPHDASPDDASPDDELDSGEVTQTLRIGSLGSGEARSA